MPFGNNYPEEKLQPFCDKDFQPLYDINYFVKKYQPLYEKVFFF